MGLRKTPSNNPIHRAIFYEKYPHVDGTYRPVFTTQLELEAELVLSDDQERSQSAMRRRLTHALKDPTRHWSKFRLMSDELRDRILAVSRKRLSATGYSVFQEALNFAIILVPAMLARERLRVNLKVRRKQPAPG